MMPEGEITRQTISGLMADHWRATGATGRDATFDLLFEVAGVNEVKEVSPGEYDKLARSLLLDAAKYRHGLKRVAKTSAK